MKKSILAFFSFLLLLVGSVGNAEFIFSEKSSNTAPPSNNRLSFIDIFTKAQDIKEIQTFANRNNIVYKGNNDYQYQRQYFFGNAEIFDVTPERVTVTTALYSNTIPYELSATLSTEEQLTAKAWLDTNTDKQSDSSWTMSYWEIQIVGKNIIISPSNESEFYLAKPDITIPPPITPSPRPANYPIEFQDTKAYSEGNYAYVEGYAKNIGEVSIEYVLIRVTFYDGKGKNVMDIGNDYVGSISKLRPGDREHFSVMVKNPGKDWRYRVELESYR